MTTTELARLTGRLRGQRTLLVALRAFCAHGLVAACLGLCVALLWRPGTPWAVGAAAAWSLGAAAVVLHRTRPRSWRAADEALGLRDRLPTWASGWGSGAGPPAFWPWLEEQLTAELGCRSPAHLRARAWRPLGRLRWLIPVLLLFLVLLFVAPLVPGLRSGPGGGPARAGGDRGATPGIGPGIGVGDAPTEEEGTAPGPGHLPPPENREDPLPDRPQPSDDPDPSVPDPPPPDPVREDLPSKDEFVVPSFVGDAETRKQWAHRAELEEGGAQPLPPGAAGGGVGLPADPQERQRAFERAAEQALRSRHVPDHERPFVRIWFETLRRWGARR